MFVSGGEINWQILETFKQEKKQSRSTIVQYAGSVMQLMHLYCSDTTMVALKMVQNSTESMI